MPELPEIETVKLQLQKVIVGKQIASVSVRVRKTVRGNIESIIGQKITDVERRGKVLLLALSSGDKLGFHFKMTGQLIYTSALHPSPNISLRSGLQPGEGNPGDVITERIVGGHPTADFVGDLPSKHTRVVFTFQNSLHKTSPPTPLLSSGEGSQSECKLYFNDQRLFGWIEINPKFVDKLGPEPLEMEVTDFIKSLSTLRRPIKVAIMDQEIISGVGNIYANDACWEAGIHPDTGCAQLSVEQLTKLFEAIKLVLREGIKYGGATAADAKYMNLHGLGGHYQDHFRTYDREGEKCLRPACRQAGMTIKRITLGGRGTFYCPNCQ